MSTHYLPPLLNWAVRNCHVSAAILRQTHISLTDRMATVINELARDRQRLLRELAAVALPPMFIIEAKDDAGDAVAAGAFAPQPGRLTMLHQLVSLPREHADLYARLLQAAEEMIDAEGSVTPATLEDLKRTVDRLHLLTRSEAAWPIPNPPDATINVPPTQPPN